MYYIRFSEKIKKMLIEHTFMNPTKECGGFLYGNVIKDNNNYFCDVDAIFFDKNKVGTDNGFVFSFSYVTSALAMTKRFDSMELVGTYHSHGNYPAIFSDVDRESLQKYFGENKITVIYSPKYSQLVGEFMDNDGVTHKTKILTKK